MADRSIVVRLRAEVGQYKQAMADAAKSTQQVGQQAVKSARDNRQAWTTAGTALTAYGAGVTALGAALLKTGIAYNQLQQTSRAAMTTLLGSAQAANEQMDRLDDFARNSPFAKQTFIQAQQQMLAFGIETQKVLPYLGAVQDAVAAMGGSNQEISEVAFIMSQISAAAKITGQDLIQFGQRGINAAELIGSQMNMTGAEVRDAITAGSLDAGQALDALAAGMSERFGGAADNVKNTFAGTMDRIKAAWRDFASEIASPLVSPDGGGILIDLGNQAADLMRAFQDLPGPVKAGTTALVGISGVASLVGGAFLLALPRIIETRAAFAQLATDMPRVAAAAGKVGTGLRFVGRAAAGMAALQVAVAGVNAVMGQFAEKLPGVNAVTRDLIALSEVPAGFTAVGLSSEFDSLADSIGRLADSNMLEKVGDGVLSVLSLGQAEGRRKSAARAEIELLDEALVNLVGSRGAPAAEAAFESLTHQYGLNADQVENLTSLLPGYEDALAGAANAADASGDATAGMTEKQKAAAEALKESRDAARDTATQFINLGDSLDDAEVSLGDWLAELEGQAQALRDFRLNAERAAERGLRQGLIAALHEAGPAGATRMAQLANATDSEIERANRAWRRGQREIRTYTNTVGGVPRSTATEVRVTGIDLALSQIARFRSALSGLGNLNPLANLRLPGSADGSTVPKDGGPYADRYPYLLAPGEEVISNRYGQADRHRSLLKAINAGRLADGGTVGGLASGGTVDRATRRAFDLGGGMSARDVRREFAELRKALGGNTRALEVAQKQSERLAKAWNRLDERIERRSDRLDSLRADRDSLVSAAAGSFNSDIFGNGVAGLRLQLEADRNDARAMRRALAGTQGLGKGLMAALASSGDLATAQELAGMSRREVRQLSRLYNRRGNAQAALGTYAGDAVYAKQIRRQEATLDRLDGTMKKFERRLNSWERAAERMPEATGREIRRAVNRQALPAGRRSK